MDDKPTRADLEGEIEARWKEAWEGASEFERRRYRSLHPAERFRVRNLIPTGEAATLGEAVKMAAGEPGFEEWMRSKERGE